MYGGYSSEREASAENAHYIEKSLGESGYETCMVPYGKNLVSTLREMGAQIVYV